MIETTGREYNYNVLDTVLQEEVKWADEANARRARQNCVTGMESIQKIYGRLFIAKR